MKGRTVCPKCNYEFITNVPDDSETYDITCPKCNYSFTINCKKIDESIECGWEEHGEPRKTILSSLKPHTSKPAIASFLLLASCILGIFTAMFLASSDNLVVAGFNLNFLTDILSDMGLVVTIIVFSGFSFIGFIFSFRRRHINVTATCAFLGIFSIGFLIGFVFSIVALILIVLSKEEFENGTKGKVF